MDAVSGYGFDSIGIQPTFQFLLFCGLKHLLFTLGEFTIGHFVSWLLRCSDQTQKVLYRFLQETARLNCCWGTWKVSDAHVSFRGSMAGQTESESSTIKSSSPWFSRMFTLCEQVPCCGHEVPHLFAWWDLVFSWHVFSDSSDRSWWLQNRSVLCASAKSCASKAKTSGFRLSGSSSGWALSWLSGTGTTSSLSGVSVAVWFGEMRSPRSLDWKSPLRLCSCCCHSGVEVCTNVACCWNSLMDTGRKFFFGTPQESIQMRGPYDGPRFLANDLLGWATPSPFFKHIWWSTFITIHHMTNYELPPRLMIQRLPEGFTIIGSGEGSTGCSTVPSVVWNGQTPDQYHHWSNGPSNFHRMKWKRVVLLLYPTLPVQGYIQL